MEKVTAYRVEKFFPPRCPVCEHPFRSQGDFADWAGKSGHSFVQAKIEQAKRFPELFEVTEAGNGIFKATDKFDIKFLICLQCENVTMRIGYAMRQVFTIEEADRLIDEEGFTCWNQIETFGHMARPYSQLSMLGAADFDQLQSIIVKARAEASAETNATKRGDYFASIIDPALLGILHKAHESRLNSSVTERLAATFNIHWSYLGQDCRSFLITAEILKEDLGSLAESNPSIDFSPAVLAYSKALERGLIEKIFAQFAKSVEAGEAMPAVTSAELVRSVRTLSDYVAGRRELTLGDMAFCLKNVGCRMSGVTGNAFAQFLARIVGDLDHFCNAEQFPSRVIKYVQEFRNKSAHVAKLSKDDCMAARAYLLEEPVLLLVRLENILARVREKSDLSFTRDKG